MCPTDQRHRLEAEVFSYQVTKDQRVRLFFEGKEIKTLAGNEAMKFMAKISGVNDIEAQLILAKATGNFKHGNEKNNKQK